MQQPLMRRGHQGGRREYYGSTYEYNIQATEDHEDALQDDGAQEPKKPRVWRIGDVPDYKPTPLRWPFILTVAALLAVAIGLIVYAEKAMPDSDTDARVLGLNPTVARPVQPRRFIRAVNDTITTPASAVQTTSIPASEPSITAEAKGNADTGTSQAVSQPPSTTEAPLQAASTTTPGTSSSSSSTTSSASSSSSSSTSSSGSSSGTSSSSSSSSPSSSSSTTPSSSPSSSPARSSPSSSSSSPTSTSAPQTTAGSTTRSQSTSAGSGSVNVDAARGSSTSTRSTSTTRSTSGAASGATVIPVSTGVSLEHTMVTVPGTTFTVTDTFSVVKTTLITSSSVFTTTSVSTSVASFVGTATSFFEISHHFTIVTSAVTTLGTTVAGGEVTLTFPTTEVQTFTSTFTTTSESPRVITAPPTVIPTYGPVTVTYYQTVSTPQDQPTILQGPINQPVLTTVTEVNGGSTVAVVNTPPPVVIALPTFEVSTQVLNPVETGVTFVGGNVVTSVVVITPSPGVPIPEVTSINGVLTTVQDFVVPVQPGQPVTYTAVNIVGGVPVTQVVVTTPTGAPFQPITYTTTRQVGGTPTVVTLTPPPTTFVTTIDGTPVTLVTTPPVTSFTTTVGGTPTAEIVVITPTGTAPITLTFVSTSGGSLSTYTRTLSPTTIVTTISGKLTTITSTPSLSTGVSTIPKSTRIYTSTLAPTGTGSGQATTLPSVISSKKVYNWGPVDVFVGTFLPPLIGIVLVIFIRVIDLNVKLYQPFQSLARGVGATGAESLTMQYTGVMAFITPMITMIQGHPVPFISTLMVGCASFIVPLATEAIGLKLHGTCYLNTADPLCGPALGISPTPANALVGLIAAVIVMLLLVLFFSLRWPTGLHANPWNIAGIASLARSAQVRIHQDSEQAMRKAVSQKQYGLGWFENEAGREEYGIILTDDSGQGLQEQQGGSDAEGFGGAGAAAARIGSKALLPLMPLRLPWRVSLIVLQLAVLVFIVYYHVYYHGKVDDGGKLWAFMNSNTFGVRFISAVVGVVIAFCWQSFFLSVSVMTPYQLMARRTQPAARSILFSPSTNPFSGIYAAVKHRHVFLFATSLAAILSEFLPVLLSNVPFSLSQTYTAASVCAIMASLFLGILVSVLIASFFVKYPPMPVDPRSIAGAMYYVSQSHLLGDFEGISQLTGKEREYRVRTMNRRYFYGVLVGGTWRRMGVDYDLGPTDEVVTAYQGARGRDGGRLGNDTVVETGGYRGAGRYDAPAMGDF
ncbi:hypothetical protein QBC47DRAFT_442913 [Echria macrotheca]|uniref:Zonadhesin n=1 Tax=Echria macrotheca TaxID=438768 RepID=A0AAJ0F7D8_9PEZI|nr:hypothetical protein QBC47DRAFT_442913 [Echria macrotheca]